REFMRRGPPAGDCGEGASPTGVGVTAGAVCEVDGAPVAALTSGFEPPHPASPWARAPIPSAMAMTREFRELIVLPPRAEAEVAAAATRRALVSSGGTTPPCNRALGCLACTSPSSPPRGCR